MKKFLAIVVIIFIVGFMAGCGNGEECEIAESQAEIVVASEAQSQTEIQTTSELEIYPRFWWAESGRIYETVSSTGVHLPPSTAGDVRVRFYRHCNIIDPNAELINEAFVYENVSFGAANFHRDFILEFNERYETQILDFWYIGTKLYVNFYDGTIYYFDWGSTGSHVRLRVALQTVLSLPNVTEVEFLVEGKRGASASHFNFEFVFRPNEWPIGHR